VDAFSLSCVDTDAQPTRRLSVARMRLYLIRTVCVSTQRNCRREKEREREIERSPASQRDADRDRDEKEEK
jgi:hypothetical protein